MKSILNTKIIFSLSTIFAAVTAFAQGDKPISDEPAVREIFQPELATVVGTYSGELKNPADGVNLNVLLNLEVKNIPESSGEGVDPVFVPKIAGTLRIYVGAASANEFLESPIVESEYKPTQNLISLVVQQEQVGRMILQLEVKDEGKTLSGLWSACDVGKIGTVHVTKEGSAP